MKYNLIISSALISFLLAGCSNESSTAPIMTIGETEISEQEFYLHLKETTGKDALKQMTLNILLNNHYVATDKEINDQRTKIMHSYGIESQEKFNSFLKENGTNLHSFNQNIRTNILLEKAAIDNVEISLKDSQTTYESLKTKVRANHILVSDLETANELLSKINDGHEFSLLASKHSIDDTTKTLGGDLGYFSEGFLDKELVEVAFSTEIGEVSKPIRTNYGYHLIQTTDKGRSFDEMKGTIEQFLLDKRKKSVEVIFEELVAKEKITIHDPQLKNILPNSENP